MGYVLVERREEEEDVDVKKKKDHGFSGSG